MSDSEFQGFSLRRPPWSGDSVRPWVRVGAWFFLVCAVLAFVGGIVYTYLDGGIPRQYWLAACLFVVGELYFAAIVAHVAIRGRAPTNWIPWT
jgi:hypothetical protein